MSKHFEIKKETEGEFHDRGSKFIGYLKKIDSEEKALQLMNEMRKAHPKANHLCYAYRLQNGPQIIENLSDDGEPTHSAGQPILRQLQSEELVNTLAMVIRYFGGVKLGVGGLMKAYKNASNEALKSAIKVEVKEMVEIRFKVSYANYGEILAILDKENLSFDSENAPNHSTIQLKVEKENEGKVKGLFAAHSLTFL